MVGVSAFLRFLKPIYKDGLIRKDITETYFKNLFLQIKRDFDRKNQQFNSGSYPSSGQSATKLFKDLMESYKVRNI